jgi:dTDP-4-amino-4,6-dideoxygalactose transaminase
LTLPGSEAYGRARHPAVAQTPPRAKPQANMDPIPFHVPSIDESDIPGVLEVLRDRWLTTGPRCTAFEQAFGEFLGGGVHCLAVNSATAALHLALEAVGLRAGDKVLTTPYTFTATAEVVRYFGADPVFADVDARTFNVTRASLAAAYEALPARDRERVRVVLPVHFAGLPCAMDELEELAAGYGWRLIDDAAHALPARRRQRLIGCYGNVTAFSFYATKTLCTGEGGMAVTRDPALAERMRTMRTHGISRDVFDRYRTMGAQWYYEVVAPGFKYNLGDIAAALGLSQLRRVEAFRSRRAAIAAMYLDGLSALEDIFLPPAAVPGDQHAWHLFALRVEGGRAVRDAFIEELAAAGIGTSVHFIPLHLHPYYRTTYGLCPEDFPIATRLFEEEVSLPIYPAMTDGQVGRVLEAVPSALARARERARGAAAQ